jgi:predicted phosphodiesterase
MSRILILGDLHAKWHDLYCVMQNTDFNLNIKYDSVIQVGDFGFYSSTFERLDIFHCKYVKSPTQPGSVAQYSAVKFHKPVYCIDGNHEDHKWLKTANHEEWKSKYNIHYQPRGSWIESNGLKIGFLGGALNADRRQEGSIDGETTNYILNKQVKRVLAEWNAIGGMDIVVTHSCPTGIGIGMEGHPALYTAVQKYIVDAGHGENNFHDCGDAPLTMLYKGLEKKPALWFFGHFHAYKNIKIENTEFMCVGSTDSSDGRKYINPLILDTKHNKIDFIDKKALNFDGQHSTRIL